MAKDNNMDPWSSRVEIKDYDEQIKRWGLGEFNDELMARIKDPNFLMTRGVIFAHRDFDAILDRIDEGEPYVMMTGLMPSGPMHMGHKLVVDQMKWYQAHGAELVIAISDIEAWLTRKMPPSVTTPIAVNEYIANYLALGLDPAKLTIYSQWSRPELLNLAQMLSARSTFGEMNAIYGFVAPTGGPEPLEHSLRGALSELDTLRTDDPEGEHELPSPLNFFDTSVPAGKIGFAFIQAADILHPQLRQYGGPRPVVVPVGFDQDPHMRLTRDLADRCRITSVKKVQGHNRVTIYLDPAASATLDELEKGLTDHFGLEKTRLNLDDAETDSIAKTPNGNGLILYELNPMAVENVRDYLIEHPAFGNAYVTLTRLGVFVPKDSKDLDSILINSKKALEDLGYQHMEVVPDYGAIFVYDNNDLTDADIRKINNGLTSVEAAMGRPVFHKPCMTYNKFARGLTGGKMSSSDPDSAIYLTDSPDIVERKIRKAPTGGRSTAVEQHERGGEPGKCIVYELMMFNHPDDNTVKDMFGKCVNGDSLCGECKGMAVDYFREWITDLRNKRKELIDSGELNKFVDSQNIIKPGDPMYF